MVLLWQEFFYFFPRQRLNRGQGLHGLFDGPPVVFVIHEIYRDIHAQMLARGDRRGCLGSAVIARLP